MARSTSKFILLACAVGALTACSSLRKRSTYGSGVRGPSSYEHGPAWNESMQRLSDTFAKLMPTLASDDLSQNEKNRGKVLDLSRELSRNIQVLNHNQFSPSADPALRFVVRDFHNETESAIALMQSEKWGEAQTKMLNTTRYCFTCHSMQQGASTHFTLSFTPDLSGLSQLQRADFHTSVRQFDQAIMMYENALSDPKWAAENEQKWNDGIKRLLAITVRVRRSASLTMEFLSQFFDKASYPKGLEDTARLWRRDAIKWRKEKTLPDALAFARSVLRPMKSDPSARQPEMTPASLGLIQYLRASALLHDYLRSPANVKNQEALYLAGNVAEQLADLNFWTFPEDYYSACVNIDEKTDMGQKCKSAHSRLSKQSMVSQHEVGQ